MSMIRTLSSSSLLLLGTTMAVGQTNDPENDERIEEVIVRSSPLRTAISEIVLGTTIVQRSEILRDLKAAIASGF